MAGARTPVRITFKTGRIISRERAAMGKAFDKVTREMTQTVRRKISKPYPPPSRAGAHPHMRTGYLKRNFEVRRQGYRIYIRMPKYGVYLEKGTRNMRPRPFVERNLQTRDKRLYWTRRINAEIRRNVMGL